MDLFSYIINDLRALQTKRNKHCHVILCSEVDAWCLGTWIMTTLASENPRNVKGFLGSN